MSTQFSFEGFEPAPATDRLFFALFPDAEAAARIGELAQRLRRTHGFSGEPLKTDRFHITLQHLGDFAGVPRALVTKARKAGDALAASPFDIAFDQAGSFHGRPSKRPFVLRGAGGEASVAAFQQKLAFAMAGAGLRFKPYTPHLTLLYDDREIEPQAVSPIRWTAKEFVLVHSLLGKTTHIPLARWALQ